MRTPHRQGRQGYRMRLSFVRILRCFPISFLVLAAVISLQRAGVAQQAEWSGVRRIVAIGDVHGDYQQFVTLLRQAQVIDQRNRWIGGATHLVQLGDVPDRGTETRKSMDLLIDLEKQAARAGGRVHALIGNHEAMNMYGDLRYVAPKDYEAYRDGRSEERRQHFYEQEIEQAKATGAPDAPVPSDEQSKRSWEAKYPLGYVEQRLAFSRQGQYGKWILGHNAIIKINDTLFLHGGISPKYAASSIQEINQKVRAELGDFSKLEGGIVMDEQGPLWYRGLAQDDETSLRPHVDQVLQHYGVARIVLGHTVTAGTVIPRLHGKVLLADAGLSGVYGSRLACLIVEGGAVYVLHRAVKIPVPTGIDSEFLSYLERTSGLDPQPSPIQQLILSLREASTVPAQR